MLKEIISKMKNTLKDARVWLLYQTYTQKTARNLQLEISETLDEAFEENKLVMEIFKERLVGLYDNDKRH